MAQVVRICRAEDAMSAATLDRVSVAPQVTERDVHRRIAQALHRYADLDARDIAVAFEGSQAMLTGRVGTWLQRGVVERAVAHAPGVTEVDNRLLVEPPQVEDETV
jgi:osmotically-inducible protein OsmY